MAESEKTERKNRKVLRREFLAGGALTAGALACTSVTAAAALASPQQQTSLNPRKGTLFTTAGSASDVRAACLPAR